jgi:hypothetical protein
VGLERFTFGSNGGVVMTSEIALWIALASGIFALFGSLGSQLISAVVTLRTKRMEIVYSRKADSYRELMQKAGAFHGDPKSEKYYSEFIHAFFGVSIIASDAVLDALNKHCLIYPTSKTLHLSNDKNEIDKNRKLWGDNIEESANQMRKDLRRFARH